MSRSPDERPSPRPPVDREAAARAIDGFLRALGYDVVGEFAGTGARVAAAWTDDLLQGEWLDPNAALRGAAIPIAPGERSLVVVRDIAVTTMCPHHLLPAHGSCVVAYLPEHEIAGFGAIAHVVDVLSRRLTLQEQIGSGVVAVLIQELGARAALCRLSLRHACLSGRGERKASAVVETLAVGGSFAAAGPDRDLVLSVIGAAG